MFADEPAARLPIVEVGKLLPTAILHDGASAAVLASTMAAGNGAAHSKYPDHMQMAGAVSFDEGALRSASTLRQ
jgi:hypothetical protein